MGFCVNCGNKLNDGSKFCDKCGTQVNVQKEEKTERDNSRAVIKCPACGELIPSYTVICPSCGYEINATEVSKNFADFLSQVTVLEKAILNSEANNYYTKAANITKKVLWIALNVILICFPLLIKMTVNLLNVNISPKLNKEEQELVTFIQNYSFPNNREVILEALMFVKEKIDFIAKEKASRKNTYWMRLWFAKAEQLKEKADILFPRDVVVQQSFAEIVKDKNKSQKSALIKSITGIALLIALIVWFFCIVLMGSEEIQWHKTGMFQHLPEPQDYYGEVIEETDNSLVIELTSLTEDEFELFKQGCIDKGFVKDVIDDNYFYYGENESGYKLILFFDTSDTTLSINLKAIE